MKFLRDALNMVQEIVADERLTQASKVVDGVLKVAATIGQAKLGGPFAIASGALATVNIIRDSFEIEKPDPIHDFIMEKNLTTNSSALVKLIYSLGADKRLPLKTFAFKNEKNKLVGIEIDGQIAAWYDQRDLVDPDPRPNLSMSKDFDLRILQSAIWESIDAPIIKLVNSYVSAWGSSTIKIETYPYDDVPYLGVHVPEDFAKQIEKFHSRGISRAILLFGAPGVGKSSFIRAYARCSKKTLMIVPPDTMAGELKSDVEQIVDMLEPGIVLFDDLDRSTDGLVSAMATVDDIRRKHPEILIVTTCNRIDETNAALLRPGRLGKKVEFYAPSTEDKVSLMNMYLSRYGTDPTTLNVVALVAQMDHPLFTHDYVRFIAEESVAMDEGELFEAIESVKEHLELTNEMEPGSPIRGGRITSKAFQDAVAGVITRRARKPKKAKTRMGGSKPA